MTKSPEYDNKVKIRLCLGSSCFSRGNKTALNYIQDYIKKNALEDEVFLKGSLCEELCKDGPHMFVDDTHYSNLDPSTVIDLLQFHLNQRQTKDKG